MKKGRPEKKKKMREIALFKAQLKISFLK